MITEFSFLGEISFKILVLFIIFFHILSLKKVSHTGLKQHVGE